MSRGHDRERALVNALRDEDWVAWRAPASLGEVDVFAMRDGRALFVEVKSTAQGPYEHFGPADRADLLRVAEWAGAEAWLVWHPPRAKPTWIPAKEWPDARS